MLICSNIRIFSRKSRNPLSADFELISAKVLEAYLPNFTVHHFGKGQCACSADDWENKQFESHYLTWRNRINFMHRPANFVFVPICFRDSNGNWFDKDKIHDSILIDRLRICALLSDVSPPDVDFYEPVEAFYKYD